MQKYNNNNMSHLWHSPLHHSIPYMNSYDVTSTTMLSMTPTSTSYEHEHDDLMYPLDEDEHDISPSTDAISIDSSSSDGSDDEIDAIRRAIEITFGSEKDTATTTTHEIILKEDTQQPHPRAKFLGKLGIGMKQHPVTVSTSRIVSTRTPPTSPVDTASDDSLDAMLALMGVSEEMSSPVISMRRSEPINIPMKKSVSRPIPMRTSRPSRPTPLDMLTRDTRVSITQTHITSNGWDSDDDDTDYFASPQCEDLSGSMLFDY